MVARSLSRLLPSLWQQRVKVGLVTLPYDEWLTIVLRGPSGHHAWQNFWLPHDLGPLLDRWVRAVGEPEQVTLVVADETDHGLVPRTVEALLGLPESSLASRSEVRNASLGVGRLEAIRRLNVMYRTSSAPGGRVPSELHRQLAATLRTAAPWDTEAGIPAMPEWARQQVAELDAARAELVRSLDVRVVGDPGGLTAASGPRPAEPDPAPGARPVMISVELAADALAVAVDAAERLAAEAAAHRRQPRHPRRRRRAPRRTGVDQMPSRQLLRVVAARLLRRLKPGRRHRRAPDGAGTDARRGNRVT